MPFEFKQLDIKGVILITPKVFGDGRGFFLETYKRSDFTAAGIAENFVQDNFSASVRGVLRGLHYQKNPAAQAKLVKCISGEIFDVAVDIRKNSPAYGKWTGHKLDDKTHKMLYIPAGFAHGFSVISETAQVLYKVTREYSPEHDRGIRWDDPDININWGIEKPAVSAKDSALPALKDCDNNFTFEQGEIL